MSPSPYAVCMNLINDAWKNLLSVFGDQKALSMQAFKDGIIIIFNTESRAVKFYQIFKRCNLGYSLFKLKIATCKFMECKCGI